ncbi:MAG: hypothetical protein AAGI66_09940, partial [Cyanobacteria bacterium P01_H01_bin.74]
APAFTAFNNSTKSKITNASGRNLTYPNSSAPISQPEYLAGLPTRRATKKTSESSIIQTGSEDHNKEKKSNMPRLLKRWEKVAAFLGMVGVSVAAVKLEECEKQMRSENDEQSAHNPSHTASPVTV